MLDLLADGISHSREELRALLPDELGAISNIRTHLTAIRKQLRPQGRDIICEIRAGQTYYRHVRVLPSANDGRR